MLQHLTIYLFMYCVGTDITASVQTLLPVYRHYCKCTDITASVQTLLQVYRHYSKCTDITASVQTLLQVYSIQGLNCNLTLQWKAFVDQFKALC